MEKSEKREILQSILETQDLGDNSKKKVMGYFDNDEPYEDAKDPLTTFIFDAVRQADSIDEVESNIGYAISQMEKAKSSIKQNA